MEHGIIQSTRYDQGVVLCDIQPIRVQKAGPYRDIPMMKSFDGFHVVPKEGQKVGMIKLSDGRRFISEIISKNEEDHYPDSMSEGELTLQLDKETKLTFEKNDSGNYNVTVSASGHLQLSGKTVDVEVRGDT